MRWFSKKSTKAKINTQIRPIRMGLIILGTKHSDCISFIPFAFLLSSKAATIFVAGLRMVPEDLYEAAKIDGAGSWQRLVYITCPMIKQTIVIVMLLIVTADNIGYETQ